MKKINIDEFTQNVNDCINQWELWFERKHFSIATNVCRTFIQSNNKQYRFYKKKSKEDLSIARCFLILIQALEELSRIHEILSKKNWYQEKSNFEVIWDIRCDCQERLEFVFYQVKDAQRIRFFLKNLREIDDIVNSYVEPSFVSPGIITDTYICNICRCDFRSCNHITGHYYDDMLCCYEPENPRIDHIALVSTPKDERCRVWPWKKSKDETIEAIMLVSFKIDNFLDSSEIEKTLMLGKFKLDDSPEDKMTIGKLCDTYVRTIYKLDKSKK